MRSLQLFLPSDSWFGIILLPVGWFIVGALKEDAAIGSVSSHIIACFPETFELLFCI